MLNPKLYVKPERNCGTEVVVQHFSEHVLLYISGNFYHFSMFWFFVLRRAYVDRSLRSTLDNLFNDNCNYCACI